MTETPRIGLEPGAYDDSGSSLLDPVSDAERAAGTTSPMEELAAELGKKVETKPVFTKVPNRNGVLLRFDTKLIDNDKRKAWRGRATKRKSGREDETDEMLFASLVIANCCDGVMMNGLEAQDGEGTPLTFRHRQLWDMVSAREPAEAIRKLFANDAHVLIASGEFILAAGYDDDLSVDPTETATL